MARTFGARLGLVDAFQCELRGGRHTKESPIMVLMPAILATANFGFSM